MDNIDNINLPKIYALAPKALAYHQQQYSMAYGQLDNSRKLQARAELAFKKKHAAEYSARYRDMLKEEKVTRSNIPLTLLKEEVFLACEEEWKQLQRAELQHKRLRDLIEASSKEIDTQKKLISLNEGKAT